MSEGRQGQKKGNQIISISSNHNIETDPKDTKATSPVVQDSGRGGARSASTATVSVSATGVPKGVVAVSSSSQRERGHPHFASLSPAFLIDYVYFLVASLSHENCQEVIAELDELACTGPSRVDGEQSGSTSKLLVLKSLITCVAQKNKESKNDKALKFSNCQLELIADQLPKASDTDLLHFAGYLFDAYPENRKKDLNPDSIFADIIGYWFPGSIATSESVDIGIILATSTGLCNGCTHLRHWSESKRNLCSSAVDYIVRRITTWKTGSVKDQVWFSSALEVLVLSDHLQSIQAVLEGSMSHNIGSIDNGGFTRSSESIGSVASSLTRDISSAEDLVRVLRDVGPGCTSSLSTFRDALAETSGGSGINEQVIARLICFFSEEAVGSASDSGSASHDEEISNILVGTLIPNSTTDGDETEAEANSEKTGDSAHAGHFSNSGGNSSRGGWDLDVVRSCLAEDYGAPKRSWDLVARSFDFVGFFIKSLGQLQIFLELYHSGAQRPPPSNILLADWKNSRGQVSLLSQLAVAPPIIYSFDVTDAERSDLLATVQDGKTPNTAWVSGSFLERLLKLSDQPHLNSTVRDIFIQGLLQCPQVLLCSLVRLQLRLAGDGGDGSSGVSGGQAGMQMKNELMRELVPYFFKPNSRHQGQTSVISAAIRQLWTISPNTVTLACIESWRSTAASPVNIRVATAQHIVGIMRLLAPEGTNAVLNNSKDVEFALAIAMVAADQEVIQLAPWLLERINSVGMGFLIQFIAYVGKQCPSSVPRSVSSDSDNSVSCLLSMENLVTSLKVLQRLDAGILNQPIPSAPGPQLSNSAEFSNNLTIGESVKALTETCLAKHPSLRSAALVPGEMSSASENDDIEEMANSYFQKIYTSENGITEVVEMLKKYKTSGNARENEIFACMIHNLFDEYRFFSKYPEKELRITGILFGMLIREQLVSSITLGIALRYVLEALRKPPGDGTNSNSGKMFRFGMFALEQFKERLHEWPQYCSHIVQIPHLKQGYADLVAEIDEAMEESQATKAGGSRVTSTAGNGAAAGSLMAPDAADKSSASTDTRINPGALPGSTPSSPKSQMSDGEVQRILNKSRSGSEDSQMQVLPNGLLGPSDVSAGSADLTPRTIILHEPKKVAVFGPGLGRAVNETESEPTHEAPTDATVDRVQFIINNMSPSNVESKAMELKDLLSPEHFGWLGNYLVVKRISTQPNFHSLYLSFLDQLGDYGTGLVGTILASVYIHVGKLLRSPKITTSAQERSLLKNLGSWLGQITLARNRPILQITLDCKELLYQGYETGMLIAVTPFVAKILEGAKNSFVFRPPNPWLMGLLGVFRALYDVDDLKMNIKFEVEVLCKNLGLKVEEIPPRTTALKSRISPVKERNPDFNVKSLSSGSSASPGIPGSGAGPSSGASSGASSAVSSPGRKDAPPLAVSGIGSLMSTASGDTQSQFGAPPAATPESTGVGTSYQSDQQQTVIPNLAAYVTINPNLAQLFQQLHAGSNISAAALKRAVPHAVDRAIREIIQPAVERSVTIACITTKEIVTKDFAMESDENKMRKAAQLMVANLAGSLALVTCREPLRTSVATHLRQILLGIASGSNGGNGSNSNPVSEQEQSGIEQCVNICATDNLELGCMLIEKAATEKAVRDMDEALAPALQARRKHREQTGQPFYDMSIFGSGSHRYPAALPEPLRPKPGGGLRPEQLLVYEAFQRMPRQSVVPGASHQGVSGNLAAPNTVRSSSTGSVPGVGSNRGVLGTNLPDSSGLPGGNVLPSPSPSISVQQMGLEALSSLASKLDNAVTTLLTAAGPRASEITLAMLPPDHEIRQLLVAVKRAASSSQSSRPLNSVETEALLGFGQSVFKRLYELSLSEPLRLETMVALLEALNECCPQLGQDMGTWATYAPTETDTQRKLHLTILLLLVRSRLVPVGEVDDFLARSIDGGRNTVWLEFSLLFVRTAVLERIAMASDMPKVLDTLTKIAEGRGLGPQQLNSVYMKPINRFLEELRTAPGSGIGPDSFSNRGLTDIVAEKASHQVRPGGIILHMKNLAEVTKNAADSASIIARNDPPGMRGQVTFLLDSWIRIHTDAQGNEKVLAQYLQLLQQHGVGKVEEQTERFFRHSTELVVEAVLKSAQPAGASDVSRKQQTGGMQGTVLNYNVADAYSQLVVLLVRYMNGGGSIEQVSVQRVALLSKILGITVRALMASYERSKQNVSVAGHWDQRPWFRILLNLIHELNSPSPVFDPISLGILSMFGSSFHVVQPSVVPGFAFAWLELVSHRMFLSNLLLVKDQKGWRIAHQLLMDLFVFLEPHLRKTELTEAIKHLYKGTLKVLLVLLHDFPSFLAGYHLSLCNVIPDNCVQVRNIILAAFPRGMVLPDPFTPNLKIDLLPEISKNPTLLSNVAGPLESLRSDLDSYLKTRHPSNFVAELLNRLYKEGSSEVDSPRVNSLVLYVGIQAIARLQNSQIAHTPEMEVIQKLMDFDDRGRYISLNAIANQLRYPSSHTHYFSCVMLFLFSEAKDEGVKEQITRVLLERLIGHRPHPWGLLITFIELIKNQRYKFWSHPFTRCATEIEKVIESVARSCMTPSSRSATTGGSESFH